MNKLYNMKKLNKSKWTSLKKLNGWKHYEVININKKNNSVELFAICDNDKKAFVNKKDLMNESLWRRGWI